MQGMEEFIVSNIYQFIFSLLVVISQLYIANKINPIKKSVERLEKSDDKQWERIDTIKESLNTLQGEHNSNACKGKRK